jgi:DnaJ family protein C protein 3
MHTLNSELVLLHIQTIVIQPNDRERETREKLQKAQIALKQSKEKNYYKILGISRTSQKKDIKAAYRKQALEWHPDKNEDKEKAEQMFQDISEAYEVLSDDELRGKYDRGEQVFDNQGGGGGGGNRHHGFPEQMFRQQRGGGGGGRQHHFHFG